MTTILYTKEQIRERIEQLAKQIMKDYKGKSILLVGILKGSFIFAADLMRELYENGNTNVDIDFLQVSSYGTAKQSSGKPKIIADLTKDIRNKHVIVVEDIIDTGYTLKFVKAYLSAKKPASVKMLAFLDKKEKREIDVSMDYIGFTLKGSPWVEGYGLDGGEFGRGRPEIGEKT